MTQSLKSFQNLQQFTDITQDYVNNMLLEAKFEKKAYMNRYMIENMIINYKFAFKNINGKYENIPLAIGEFGWPRDAVGINKDFLTSSNAKGYLSNFKRWLESSNNAIPSFLFAFKDEEGKVAAHPGGDQNSENRFGLYTDSANPVDILGLCK